MSRGCTPVAFSQLGSAYPRGKSEHPAKHNHGDRLGQAWGALWGRFLRALQSLRQWDRHCPLKQIGPSVLP